jgi:hypothetical protein
MVSTPRFAASAWIMMMLSGKEAPDNAEPAAAAAAPTRLG